MLLSKRGGAILLITLMFSGCSLDLTEQGIRRAEQLNRSANVDINEQQCKRAGGKLEVREGGLIL